MALCFLSVVTQFTRKTAPATPTSWTGVLINSTCNADEAFNEAANSAPKADPEQNWGCMPYSIRQVYSTSDPPSKKLRGKWKTASP